MSAAGERASGASDLIPAPVLIGGRFLWAKRVVAVAWASSRELLRERLLYVLVVFALLMIGAALVLGELSVGQERRIVLDVGLGAMRGLGIALAIILGVRLIEREIERRTVYVLLAKPVRRWEVLVGKFLGGAFVLLASMVVMTGGLVLTLAAVGEAVVRELLRLLPAVFLVGLQCLIALALAILFSTFSTAALAMIFALSLVLIGHASRELLHWAEIVRSPLLAGLSRALYYVLPNMQNLNLTAAVVHGREIAPVVVGTASVYAGLYVAVVLLLAASAFQRRDFR